MEQYDYFLYIPNTKQLVEGENEEEALETKRLVLESGLYCWLIYMKK